MLMFFSVMIEFYKCGLIEMFCIKLFMLQLKSIIFFIIITPYIKILCFDWSITGVFKANFTFI